LLALSWAAVLALQSRPAPSAALGQAPAAQTEPYAALRRRMIERDLRGRGIKNARVLEAIEAVPRHLFVPEKIRHAAYEDRALPIGDGQTISQPYIVALMTELLDPQPAEKVLEIGTGSGYQTAVLAHLAQRVYSIEILPALGASARRLLDRLGLHNIEYKIGDGFYGWEEHAPFDAVLVAAAAPRIPEPLWQQLREGGRIIIPLGEQGKTQRLVRATKTAGKLKIEDFSAVLFVPLRGAVEKPAR
jgi:protein-L-isoaspartate(D-aspartate) O-methyltransferase